ncbi:hypothetical protein J6590_042806 [Homalodisca vitripennis]|nr:hypothetical protein J6590_042806 [Homalodisca vitripennis]
MSGSQNPAMLKGLMSDSPRTSTAKSRTQVQSVAYLSHGTSSTEQLSVINGHVVGVLIAYRNSSRTFI